MKIAIIGAMSSEIKLLLEEIENLKERIIGPYIFYEGKYKNINLVITSSGIGKTLAGGLIGVLASNFIIDKIINVGICGGRQGKTNIGDVVIPVGAIYGDVDIPNSKYSYGQLPGFPLLLECDKDIINKLNIKDKKYLLTSDSFIINYNKSEVIINDHFSNFNIVGYDMESAAFIQMGYLFKIPVTIIRVISDIVGITIEEEYMINEEKCARLSNKHVLEILDLI